MLDLAWILIALTTLWIAGGLAAVIAVRRRRRRRASDTPGISVLKPLRGADPDLRENLESFFQQDYPSFELLFGLEDPNDPARPIVEALCREHPEIPARMIVHRARPVGNPKVGNLLGILPHARHTLVLISDSNIRAPKDYLRDLAATYLAPGRRRAGIVSNLFAGSGEDGLGSALENTQLNGFIAAGTATPVMMGDAVVVGKSMFFDRAVFARLGGLSRVQDVLAEDYVIGKMFQQAGLEARLGRVVLANVTRGAKLSACLDRHLRWSMLRSRLAPLAFALEPLASPLVILPFAAFALGGLLPALALCLLLYLLRDTAQWIVLRGWRRAWIPLVLGPIRDLSMLYVWARAPFERSVSWRGHQVRVGPGTRIERPLFTEL
jgi:ceramide glucosyltransferase